MDVTFFFDFGSPNAWFAHRVLPGVAERTGARFAYVPVLLGGIFRATGNQAPMVAFAGVPAKTAYMQAEMARFVRRHGLGQFRFNPHFPVNTLMLMRTACAAEAQGLLTPYAEAMFRYMWEEPRKLDDPAVLADTLAEAGLPADALLAAAQTQEVKDRLAANTGRAVETGVFGIPSFLAGGELYFGKDGLMELESDLRAGLA